MDLRICRYFLTIVEEGSMNRAARVLHITQPTLSRQIAQLENELDVQLFERQSRALVLTGAGLLFARRAREMLELEKKLACELHASGCELHGELQIGTGEFQANNRLLELIRIFMDRHPGVRISMVTGTADQCREMLENGLLDLALFLNPASLRTLHSRTWTQQERWVAVLRRDHPLARKPALGPEDLQQQPLILPCRHEPSQVIQNWLGLPAESLQIRALSSLTSNGALMVLHGIGILISIGGSPSFFHPELVERPLMPDISSSLRIAWKEHFPRSPILDCFLHFLDEELQDSLLPEAV